MSGQIGACDLAQVVDFLRGDPRTFVFFDLNVRGADQREFLLIRDDEDDALVGILQNVRVRTRVDARHHDVTALDVPHRLGASGSADLVVNGV